jgi:hypothetical protein
VFPSAIPLQPPSANEFDEEETTTTKPKGRRRSFDLGLFVSSDQPQNEQQPKLFV